MFLGTWTMVVCLKHVDITYSDRERLNILVNVDLFESLTHIGCGECYHTVICNSWCSHACFSVTCLEASIEVI
jgi:hypothetical protein